MERPFDEERLVHYFAGACGDEERAEIEAWMAADPLRRARVEALRRVWEAAGGRPPRWDVDRLWEELEGQMEPEASPPSPRRPPLRPARTSTRRRTWPQALAVAATMAAVAVTAFVAGQWVPSREAATSEGLQTRTIATAPGQRAQVELSDGTRVRLNVGSTLTLPVAFTAAAREVHLDGEAFFEVAPDAGRPFLVSAGGATVRVVGTAFNVAAYGEPTEVVVAEGRVALRTSGQPAEADVVLGPGELGRLTGNPSPIAKEVVDVRRYLAWTEGRLVFEDASFAEVAVRLERWYDLDVGWAGDLAAVDKLNASFRDEPLSEILNVVAVSLGLEYQRDGRKVTFSPATSS